MQAESDVILVAAVLYGVCMMITAGTAVESVHVEALGQTRLVLWLYTGHISDCLCSAANAWFCRLYITSCGR
jgi:hypothetical protein